MYTFNEFQFQTSLQMIYKAFSSSKINGKESLEEFYKYLYNNSYKKIRRDSIHYIVGLGVLAGATVSFIIAATTSNTIPSIVSLTGTLVYELNSCLMSMYDKYLIDVNAKKGLENFILYVKEELQKSDSYKLTDDMIHQMTLTLQDGELEENYEYLNEYGKCPIFVIGTGIEDGMSPEVYLPIKDYHLSRVYEIIMYIINNASPGYEEIVKEAYHVIRSYVDTKFKEKPSKEELEDAEGKLLELEQKLVKGEQNVRL